MNLTDPIFTDKDKAREYLEASRWPHGAVCPHCENADRVKKLEGKKHRPGLFQCGGCRKQFTVTVGTVFERSKVPLNKWLMATHLMASSKKGISAHQLHRSIGVTYKTAWFMFHRIREAMRDDTPSDFGSGGGHVEVDETYIGENKGKLAVARSKVGKGHRYRPRAHHHKYKVLTLIDRDTGEAKSVVIDDLRSSTLGAVIAENVSREAILMTDELAGYVKPGKDYADHKRVRHRMGEYVKRNDADAHTNTVEGYFSIFKRGMKGVYQHCGRQHLHRYAAEFAFRYSNRVANGFDDTMRAEKILKGAEGKRLTYRRTDARANA